MKTTKLFFISCLFVLTSCSSYVDKWHDQIDEEEGLAVKKPPIVPFDQYRQNSQNKMDDFNRNISSSNKKNVGPKVKRKYEPEEEKKRYSEDDLNDHDNVGSLWAGSGNDSYLFSKNTEKQNGDIVVINVFPNLKEEIAQELKRAFPERKEEKDATKATPEPPKEEAGDPNKAEDRISTVVIEEINRDHLLLRGRKTLLYKSFKRLVEIQALVARKDIGDDDSVSSKKILESSIIVLR